jgi:hypothetical protein
MLCPRKSRNTTAKRGVIPASVRIEPYVAEQKEKKKRKLYVSKEYKKKRVVGFRYISAARRRRCFAMHLMTTAAHGPSSAQTNRPNPPPNSTLKMHPLLFLA